MTQIKNHINSYADMTSYNSDLNKEFPNISYIEGTDEVKYSTNILVAKYNILTTGNSPIVYSTTSVDKMWIDGVEQSYPITAYQFATTGEHTVKMTFQNSTQTPSLTFNGITLLTSVIIPNTITRINGSFLRNCNNLTNVIIPDSVTNIQSQAFYASSKISTITIPSGVTYIDSDAFRYCDGLTSITCLATTPPTLGNNTVFQTSNSNDYPIYVPTASVDAYKAKANWSAIASRIQAIPA